MRTHLLVNAALASVLAMSAAALAYDDAGDEQGLAIDLGPAEDSPNVGVATEVEAAAILDGSPYHDMISGAAVTGEDGAIIGTVKSCRHAEDGTLETLVIEAEDGEWYDLPAETARFDAGAAKVTTTASLAELDLHRNPLERAGDAIEDLVDDDAYPEDLGPDHHPDANDVDDPEIAPES